MDPNNWVKTLEALPKIQEIVTRQEDLVFDQISSSSFALLLHAISKHQKKNILIVTSPGHENELIQNLRYFFSEVSDFPAWEGLITEEIAPSPDIIGERYAVLKKITENQTPVIVTSMQAILQKMVPEKKFKDNLCSLKIGDLFGFHSLQEKLKNLGYQKCSVVTDKREYAVRGSIVDCFAVDHPLPYRIEFSDDKIISLRTFDPNSQLTVNKLDKIVLTLSSEQELVKEQSEFSTIFDYLPQSVVVFEDIALLEEKALELTKVATGSKTHLSLKELFQKIQPHRKLYFARGKLEEIAETSMERLTKTVAKLHFECFGQKIEALRVFSFFLPLRMLIPQSEAPFLERFLSFLKQGIPLHILYDRPSDRMLLEKIFPPQTTLEQGYLSEGFYLEEPPFILTSYAELNSQRKIIRQKQRAHTHFEPLELFELTQGEHVVHADNGIGRFRGIEKKPNHLGIETEFMVLEYADNGILYVPLQQANLVTKYIGANDQAPSLHAIGSSKWQKTKEKTEQAIIGYAQDLLKLQAKRTSYLGEGYGEDSSLFKQFAEEFPYEETPDQLRAINLILQKLTSPELMDALVLGDVGFGKTEVAMRAAFKTVVDGGKQVAVLVPTTVLAKQHYESFEARMGQFSVRTTFLSRYLKPKEIKQRIQEIKEGTIDIIIGTHRLLSKDLEFPALGLVIIDEEQRFGVRAKEHLKKIKEEVNCLTLSATPIPRTLYLSLIGVRDLAVINTPPEDRLPIQSFLASTNDELIATALKRELARDGQAFIIHNRVETIYEFTDRIRSLVPQAKIAIGHGQMDPEELDLIFHAFKTGAADILIATSIIENGIDIPNANTILIDRADRFGLADLYQMRGRVGRWNRKAYCYLLVPNILNLPELPRKRLTSLLAATGPGGGMKIAMHDLELRGAGNILGTEQSGHVAQIGFHLYCKLLKKVMQSLKGKGIPSFQEVKLDFPYPAKIPEFYLSDHQLRLQFYQRFGDCTEEKEIDSLFQELQDRFGPPPQELLWLNSLTKIRLYAQKQNFAEIKLSSFTLTAKQRDKNRFLEKKILFTAPKRAEDLDLQVLFALQQNFPTR